MHVLWQLDWRACEAIVLLVQYFIVSDGKLKIMDNDLKVTWNVAVLLVVAGGGVLPVQILVPFSILS